MLYMVTFTINIPPMLVYIPAPWIRHGIERIQKEKKENGRRHLKLKLETRLYFSGAVLRRRGVLFIDQILGLK